VPSLVTGCAGFIGSHLTERLLADGERVVGVDCFNDNYGRRQKLNNLERALEWDSFEFVPIDLARGQLEELVEETDVIYHLAAEPGVRSSWGDRFEAYLRNNVLATQHLLEAAHRLPDTRLVYASSSSVYGQAETFPTPEDVMPRPFSPYGVTKLSGEHMCSLYHANHGLATVSLRYFSVFGPRQRPDMAFYRFCRSGIEGTPVDVFGDGSQTRDFTFVGDIVDATLAAAARAHHVAGHVYNVGGGARVPLSAAIEIIAELTGRRLAPGQAPAQLGDVVDTGADISRAAADLAYEPKVTLEDGLRAEFEWLLAQVRDRQRA
jgi:UDP-glucuronate 4-epimerase